jgi:uncharacterized MnhB-related membrane protein
VTAILALAFVLVATTGTVTVATRRPLEQAVVVSLFGQMLSVLFLALQSPDVALSAIVVGSAVVPFMVVLTLVKVKSDDERGVRS